MLGREMAWTIIKAAGSTRFNCWMYLVKIISAMASLVEGKRYLNVSEIYPQHKFMQQMWFRITGIVLVAHCLVVSRKYTYY